MLKQQQSCASKRAYSSPEQAAKAVRGRNRYDGKYLRVYHCPVCQMFHLTSQKPR